MPYEKKTTKDRKKSFGIQNWPYLQNMYAKFHINRIKIEGVITSRVGPKNGAKTGAEKFPTDCFGQINRYERRPSGFMKKMNGGKYRVTRFAHNNNNNNKMAMIMMMMMTITIILLQQ